MRKPRTTSQAPRLAQRLQRSNDNLKTIAKQAEFMFCSCAHFRVASFFIVFHCSVWYNLADHACCLFYLWKTP